MKIRKYLTQKELSNCGHCKGTGKVNKTLRTLNPEYIEAERLIERFSRLWRSYQKRHGYTDARYLYLEHVRKTGKKANPALLDRFDELNNDLWFHRRMINGDYNYVTQSDRVVIGLIYLASLYAAEKNGWTPGVEGLYWRSLGKR